MPWSANCSCSLPHESAGLLAFPERALAFSARAAQASAPGCRRQPGDGRRSGSAAAHAAVAGRHPVPAHLSKRLIDESGIYLYPMPELRRRMRWLWAPGSAAAQPARRRRCARRHAGAASMRPWRQPAGAAARRRPDPRPRLTWCCATCATRAASRSRISTVLSTARRGGAG